MNNRQVTELRAAMLSLDETQIRDYCRRWKLKTMPDDPDQFWGGVHKARCQMTTLPAEARAESMRWLTEHGMTVPVGRAA